VYTLRRKDANIRSKAMDRGQQDSQTRISEHDGEIMTIAKKEVITAAQTITIKEAAEIMVNNKFRRLPITDAGSGKLVGIVTAMDILDFLGGGQKSKLLEEKYEGNFLAGINKPVKEIMTRGVVSVSNKDSISAAVDIMLEKHIGALPVVNADEQIVGIVSERDISFLLSGVITDEVVDDVMTDSVITTTIGTPLESASKIMVRNHLRRLPVIGKTDEHPDKDLLVGIVTATDILEYFGNNGMFGKLTSNDASDVLNTKISEIIETNVISTTPNVKLGDLCKSMEEQRIGGLPVVQDDEVVGIITESDLLSVMKK
jgi:CBS domain-containing protein